jgi:hypothetical protein
MNASIGEPDFAENLARWVEPGCQDGFPYPEPSPRTELYSLKMGGKPSWLEDCLSGLWTGKLNVVPILAFAQNYVWAQTALAHRLCCNL